MEDNALLFYLMYFSWFTLGVLAFAFVWSKLPKDKEFRYFLWLFITISITAGSILGVACYLLIHDMNVSHAA